MYHIFYLHGFKSQANSVKGTLLQRYCKTAYPHIKVHLPDLNSPPQLVIEQIKKQIDAKYKREHICFVGSSLGGFYATYLAHHYDCSGVLINPVIRPWQLFETYIGLDQLPYEVTPNWSLTLKDIQSLKQYDTTDVPDLSKLLVLLQQGDATLDYKATQHYYGERKISSMIMTECGGNHVMDNFAEKIPMLLVFLLQHLSLRNI